MGELLEALGHVAFYALLVGVFAWLAYLAFGPQVFGLPVLLGILTVFTLTTLLSNIGPIAIGLVLIGVLVLWLVIGMAMSLGPQGVPDDGERPPEEESDRPR